MKLLVRKGYFLLPRFMPDERHLGWRGYFPSISGSQGDDCSTKSLDEVQNLHVLRAMAKPCYVLTCYTVVASPTLGETEKCNFVCCRPALGLVTFAKSMICDDHNCPLSPDCAPNSACTVMSSVHAEGFFSNLLFISEAPRVQRPRLPLLQDVQHDLPLRQVEARVQRGILGGGGVFQSSGSRITRRVLGNERLKLLSISHKNIGNYIAICCFRETKRLNCFSETQWVPISSSERAPQND